MYVKSLYQESLLFRDSEVSAIRLHTVRLLRLGQCLSHSMVKFPRENVYFLAMRLNPNPSNASSKPALSKIISRGTNIVLINTLNEYVALFIH